VLKKGETAQRRVYTEAWCPYCFARPGKMCTTSSGKKATDAHKQRHDELEKLNARVINLPLGPGKKF